MSTSIEDTTSSGSVTVSFADAARRYLAYIDQAALLDDGERLRRARLHLSDLIHRASQLPEGNADGPDLPNEARPTEWRSFGEVDEYFTVFDPYVEEPLVTGSLSDDLLDVYRDLHRGLSLYDSGQVDAAVWEWKFHFDHHWGYHAVDALRALQRACLR